MQETLTHGLHVRSIDFISDLVGKPIDMTMITHHGTIVNVARRQWLLRFKYIFMRIQRKDFVSTALCDVETSLLASFERRSRSVLVANPTGSNQHVPAVEAKIKLNKTKVRGNAAPLPYQ